MEKSDPLTLCVDEACESYLACKKHAIEVHLVLGTQRLLELRGSVNGSTDQKRVTLPSVKDDLESLRGIPNIDFRVVLGIHEVCGNIEEVSHFQRKTTYS